MPTSSDAAIRVEGLGKRYRLGERQPYRTVRDTIAEALRPRRRRGIAAGDTHVWALRDVSLAVAAGEAVGIVGGNGAGKSTLLKILSRITEPTEGRAEVRGRVGALLEVGTGFHPELTGRENILLNGAVLGMKRAETARKFDAIVDFAEVARFIDTPVKFYSTGMYMRLAFAVAAHLEPQILIVDEVLAVGDAAFQRKCLGRMGDVTREGRTVLFVSHNMAAVESLCDRAVWLRDGRAVDDGPPSTVISRYLQESLDARTERHWPDTAQAPGNEKVRLHRAAVRAMDGSPGDPITVRTPFVIEFEYWNLQEGARLNLSLHIYDEQGTMAFNAVPFEEAVWQGKPFPRGLFRDTCRIPSDLMNDGMHRVELLVVQDEGTVIHREEDVITFEVRDAMDHRGTWYGRWPGAVRPVLDWTTELVIAADRPPVAADGRAAR